MKAHRVKLRVAGAPYHRCVLAGDELTTEKAGYRSTRGTADRQAAGRNVIVTRTVLCVVDDGQCVLDRCRPGKQAPMRGR